MNRVMILHVPYEFRGGEDLHVERLSRAYEELGMNPFFYPSERKPRKYALTETLRSLTLSSQFDELDRIFENEKPDLIHAHHIYPLFGPRFLRWAIARKVRLALTVHNHRFFCTNGLALRGNQTCKACFDSTITAKPVLYNCNDNIKKSAYYTAALNQNRSAKLLQHAVSLFIAPSPYIRDELVRWGIAPERVKLLINSVEAEPPSTTASERADAFDVFYAGRLSQEKGIAQLLECARLMPETVFGIAGDGPLRESVARCGMKNVFYLGTLEHAKLLATLSRAKIGVLPSLCNEILPTFVLECFSLGKRCVVPDLESTRWLASHYGEWNTPLPGVVADTSDTHNLVRMIRETLAMPALEDGAGERIREKLSLATFSKGLDSILDEMA